jgi:hypothetical protein
MSTYALNGVCGRYRLSGRQRTKLDRRLREADQKSSHQREARSPTLYIGNTYANHKGRLIGAENAL